MITEKEIEQAAKEYAPIEPSVNDSNELKRESFKAGANFVLKDMDSEMEKFDEWKENERDKEINCPKCGGYNYLTTSPQPNQSKKPNQ